MMNEKEWVRFVIETIQPKITVPALKITDGQKLPYAYEIRSYVEEEPLVSHSISYETDILVAEYINPEEWKPRVIIEAKINSVTTHDAITYSQKATTHKNVHPYLRYGILIGNCSALPGRLFRHGAYFDFMLSWQDFTPSEIELENLLTLVLDEVETSRQLEEIIFDTRRKDKERYIYLRKPLQLKSNQN